MGQRMDPAGCSRIFEISKYQNFPSIMIVRELTLFEQEKKSNSDKLTPAQISMINKVEKGGKVIFSNIVGKDAAGKIKKLKAVVVIID